MPSRIPSGLSIKQSLDFVIGAGDWVYLAAKRGPLTQQGNEYIFGQTRFVLDDVRAVFQGLDENQPDNLAIYLKDQGVN